MKVTWRKELPLFVLFLRNLSNLIYFLPSCMRLNSILILSIFTCMATAGPCEVWLLGRYRMNDSLSLKLIDRVTEGIHAEGFIDIVIDLPKDPLRLNVMIRTFSQFSPEKIILGKIRDKQKRYETSIRMSELLPQTVEEITGKICLNSQMREALMPWTIGTGANCFGSALYWHNPVGKPQYVGPMKMEMKLAVNFVELPPGETLEFGDVLVERPQSFWFGAPKIGHAMIYVGNNLIWHKPSMFTASAWQFDVLNVSDNQNRDWRAYRSKAFVLPKDPLFESRNQRNILQTSFVLLTRLLQVIQP